MTAVAQQVSTKVTTVATRVRDRGRDMPDRIALREKDFGIWQEVSWADYWNCVRAGRARPAGAGHRAGRPGRDPFGEPPRVAVLRRRRDRGAGYHCRPVPDQSAAPRSPTCCRTPAPGCWSPRTRSRSTRRWRCSTKYPTSRRSSTSSRAASGIATPIRS